MSAPVQTAARPRIRFNPFDPAFRRDPYPVYERLRNEAPFFRTLDTVVLSRYDDVLETLKSRAFSAELIPQSISRHAAKLGIGGIEQVDRFIRNSIVFTDNPAHYRLRRLVGQAYTAPAIQGLRGLIRTEVMKLLDPGAQAGGMDLVGGLAKVLPLNVLCTWMGVPEESRSIVGPHIHSIRFLLDPGLMTRTDLKQVLVAMKELCDFFDALYRQQREADGPETLILRLAGARNGDDRLGDEEVVFACIMSFVAGSETSQSLIGNAVNALLKHPEQFRAVAADRRLVTRAVEETLRYETPLQLTKRQAFEDVQVGSNTIKSGEQVLLCLASANRDAARYESADRFDLMRDGPPHVGFGYGMHTCLGGLLARVQTEVVLECLLERFATIERAEEEEVWQTESLILRGLERLPVRLAGA